MCLLGYPPFLFIWWLVVWFNIRNWQLMLFMHLLIQVNHCKLPTRPCCHPYQLSHTHSWLFESTSWFLSTKVITSSWGLVGGHLKLNYMFYSDVTSNINWRKRLDSWLANCYENKVWYTGFCCLLFCALILGQHHIIVRIHRRCMDVLKGVE